MYEATSPSPWHAVIVVDGEPPVTGWSRFVDSDASVIAADGGVRHAREEAVPLDYCVGDFDSLSETDLDACRRDGVEVIRYPTHKDATDFALALDLADDHMSRTGPRLLVVGGRGGRLDHEIGNIMLLAHAASRSWSVTAFMGEDFVQIVTPAQTVGLIGMGDGVVSLIPLGGATHGVATVGLRWELNDADLEWGSARGLSNVIDEPPASVSTTAGTILVCEPGGVRDLLTRPSRRTK